MKPAVEQLHVKLTLGIDFETFGPTERDEFLRDLERVSGCPREEMEDIQFRPGCIIFEGNLDAAAVARLKEIFEAADDGSLPAEVQQFLEKYRVSGVDGGVTARIQILRRTAAAQIVFVHGWRGDEDSFGELPAYLESALGVVSGIYQYPTSLWKPGSSPSIQFIADNLDNWIRNHLKADAMAFVAHSMGGLVVRKFVVSQYWRARPLDALLKQLTFVASPHDGAVLASLVDKIPFFRGAQLDELSPNSPLLFELNSYWQRWYERNVPMRCAVRCLVGTKDEVVSVNNARGLDPEPVPILNADHSSIVTPGTPDDEVVLTLTRFMREAHLIPETDTVAS